MDWYVCFKKGSIGLPEEKIMNDENLIRTENEVIELGRQIGIDIDVNFNQDKEDES